jgi:hypothetical protein
MPQWSDGAAPETESGGANTSLRRLLRQLHRILRDGEGSSSLLERFDELTRILFCRRVAEKAGLSLDTAIEARRFFEQVVAERPDLFPARFARLGLADATIERLLEALRPVPLAANQDDLAGLAYEDLIRNTFDKGDNQQFFTPRLVVEHMTALVGPALEGIVCDPACGTGGFLVEAGRQQRRHGRGRLLGFEIDERLAWIAGINLELHGITGATIRRLEGAGSLGPAVADTLGGVDAILTNPPFGSDLSDAEALASFRLGAGRSSRRRGVLFVERCLDLLRPGGLLAIILDDSVLNGAANRDVRRLLCDEGEVLAVVALPETAFLPYASVRSSILLVRKKGSKSQPAGDTFFARAEQVGRKPNGEPLWVAGQDGVPTLESDLPAILSAWHKPAASPSGPGQRPLVFRTHSPGAGDSLFGTEGHRLDLAYHHPARHEALAALAACRYPLLPLGEICTLRNELLVPARDLEDEQICYIGLANIEASTGKCEPVLCAGSSVRSSVRRCQAGDLLFARLRPELRKVCLLPAALAYAFASPECLILVPGKSANGGWLLLPELLSQLLRSDLVYGQLVHLVTGIGRPRLSRQSVLAVRLPVPPPRVQRDLWQAVQRAERRAEGLQFQAQQLQGQAQAILAQAGSDLLQELGMKGN